MNYEKLKRLPIDPRVIEKIQKSPQMMAEQGSTFLEEWDGPQKYKFLAKLPTNQRVTYVAVERGHTDPMEISTLVGLTPEQVEAALTELEKKGLISIQEIAI